MTIVSTVTVALDNAESTSVAHILCYFNILSLSTHFISGYLVFSPFHCEEKSPTDISVLVYYLVSNPYIT